MGRKFILKLDKELLVFITVIYYSSKLLWDNLIPYVFTFGYIAVCVIYTVKYLRRINRRELFLFFYFAVFAIYVTINAVLQDETAQLIRAIYEYIVYALPFFLILYCLPYVNITRLSRKIVKWGCIIGTLSWYEYLTRSFILHVQRGGTGILYGGSYAFRAVVFSRSALSHGIVIGFFAIIAFYLYLSEKNCKILICTSFLVVSILTTSSRGPLVSTVFSMFLMYVIHMVFIEHSSTKKILSTITVMMFSFVILFVLTSDFQTNNETINYFLLRIRNIINWDSDAGNVGRLHRWKWALSLYNSSPIWGIGPSKTGSWGSGSLGVTESGVLKRLCELGIVGFILHYSFIVITFIISMKKVKCLDERNSKSMVLFICLLASVLVNDFIVQSTEEPAVCFIMWFSLAGMVYFQNSDRLIKDTL